MKVFKFGGASVKHAEAVKNVVSIVTNSQEKDLVIIVSAMGKMTNAFEWLINSYCFAKNEIKKSLNDIIDFHYAIINELFPDTSHQVYIDINELFHQIEDILEKAYNNNYDETYDSLICYGELLSTTIISHYLNDCDVNHTFLDARKLIKTDDSYRQARVNWDQTSKLIKESCENGGICLTQGFIGSSHNNSSTSLGREGSDFTGGIFAYSLDAKSLTIWKDVAGMLNADPKHFPKAIKLDQISYKEAIELSYYGASVIHPKTIKPLQNKNIPLLIKSFLHPDDKGSVIQESEDKDNLHPSYIFIEDQILLSFSPRDFSFIAEEGMSLIFTKLNELGIKVNLMQNSALNFSICIKHEERKVNQLISELSVKFKILYNKPVTLFTIRHYTELTIQDIIAEKKIYLEQKSRHTARFVIG